MIDVNGDQIKSKVRAEIVCAAADAWCAYEGNVTRTTFSALCEALRRLDVETSLNPLRKLVKR